MTTKITVEAHAGWPVAVYALDSFSSATAANVTEHLLEIIPPGDAKEFHATSNREIRCVELPRTDIVGLQPVPNPLDFASVVRGLKAGKRFARAGWNGKGMFIFLVPGSRFTVNREPLLSILGDGAEVDYHAHIDMKTAQGYVVPWLASQADVLAEDWTEVVPA
ncbi:MAG: hypothetical protein H6Q99_313 [Proteobacteria bacterium]|nr:hypothetical protein [Pseudomonadota bacterium]